MAGISKEPGPTAERTAANLRRIRRSRNVTTAGLSQRLAALGHPIADTGITKTEAGTRRVDVDDLVPLALALGVTPNTLLMPDVDYLGNRDIHQLTPAVSGTAVELWQWAQGEKPLTLPVPDLPSPFGGNRVLEFSVRTRPYLTAAQSPAGDDATPAQMSRLRDLSIAVQEAMKAGASGTEIRRVTEMTMTHPPMTDDEITTWLDESLDGEKP